MYAKEVLRLYPDKRVKAFDGMAVTADVWESAHDYHRRLLEVHTRFAHGAGILYGLEVIADEPPSRQVFVQPGIAIDHLGRTIILAEQQGFELRAAEGVTYLVLSYSESPPRTEANRGGEDAPRFVLSGYALEALAALPRTPFVELARVHRHSDSNTVSNAEFAELPHVNEIDLRYRVHVGRREESIASMAVVPLSSGAMGHVRGAAHLARALRQNGSHLVVEHAAHLDALSAGHTLAYLVGVEEFRLGSDHMTALYNYHRQGGFIFYESARSATSGDPAGDGAFLELMSSMGIPLHPVAENHPLLSLPHLFAAPPDGFETQGTPRLLAGERVLLSGFDYGSLWQGKRRGRPAGRGEIRSALEFGENIVAFARYSGRRDA